MTTDIEPLAFAILASTPRVVRELLLRLPDDAITTPLDDGWSVKDVLAHLGDVESVAFGDRIEHILAEEHPAISSIDATARLEALGLRERSLVDLLHTLATNREAHVAWARGLTSEQLARIGDHDQAGDIAAGDIVHQIAYHDLMHLGQMQTILAQQLVAYMGNTRRFYDL